ncbi:hypothetical protein [Nocardia sp. NPDC050413]|uniref:hypothetical protein n=1 Tax=Nocardia sp. NPDC050413 TaxID=3155784 RepID=UPI00340F9381
MPSSCRLVFWHVAVGLDHTVALPGRAPLNHGYAGRWRIRAVCAGYALEEGVGPGDEER